ncbi:predicted protein [Histoplasma capsulatum H143]|uniref:Uncharacterized protein n=1 Tax=Ajellomyces capsulatus (strain H143) TaxID=544712 RepID=C6H9G5_AJECH|nr:predicted protein [Histoplasma capsulatum H143]
MGNSKFNPDLHLRFLKDFARGKPPPSVTNVPANPADLQRLPGKAGYCGMIPAIPQRKCHPNPIEIDIGISLFTPLFAIPSSAREKHDQTTLPYPTSNVQRPTSLLHTSTSRYTR